MLTTQRLFQCSPENYATLQDLFFDRMIVSIACVFFSSKLSICILFWRILITKSSNFYPMLCYCFQCDCIMCEVADVHRRASARCIYIYHFFLENGWSFHLIRIPQLGLCKALWSCKSNLYSLVHIVVHYMEKNPRMFSSKTFISFRL